MNLRKQASRELLISTWKAQCVQFTKNKAQSHDKQQKFGISFPHRRDKFSDDNKIRPSKQQGVINWKNFHLRVNPELLKHEALHGESRRNTPITQKRPQNWKKLKNLEALPGRNKATCWSHKCNQRRIEPIRINDRSQKEHDARMVNSSTAQPLVKMP